ncbi:MAG: hypothetical protein DCE86_05475 [Flavobacteriaceae bacterium]|nr:MAG: hypothetical protein DCE86_05475 [Flavobacteriaceae bacterium]
MEKTSLITDKSHRFFGCRFPAECIYKDSTFPEYVADLFLCQLPDGTSIRVLSKQIDIGDWQAQCIAETKIKYGIELGSIIMITKIGSGFYDKNFDTNQPHLVTDFLGDGSIVCDYGKAQIYNAEMEIYTGEVPIQTYFTKTIAQTLTDIFRSKNK